MSDTTLHGPGSSWRTGIGLENPLEETLKPLRGRSLGTKLTEVEYAKVEAAALRAGVGLSEWGRRTVLDAASGEDDQETDLVLLEELLSLRGVLLNVMFRLATGSPLNAEEMRQLIERADRDKRKRAAALLNSGEGDDG